MTLCSPPRAALLLALILSLIGSPLLAADLMDNGDLAPGGIPLGAAPSRLTQAAGAQQAYLQQLGQGNLAELRQNGQALSAQVLQQGSDQEAFILQHGEDLLAVIEQVGHGN